MAIKVTEEEAWQKQKHSILARLEILVAAAKEKRKCLNG